jgi:CDGSH-type Zn-finger protein
VLVAAVEPEAGAKHNHHQGGAAIPEQILPVLFKKSKRLFDLEGELVGLQLFAGDSCHENLNLSGTFSWYHGVPVPSYEIGHATIRKMSAKISPITNGPIRIEGEFEIVDPAGQKFGLAGRTVISLCRCGLSANKPFCDGSHSRQGFSHTVVACELPPPKPKV